MKVFRDPDKIRTTVRAWRRQGERVGFVPTMGYLHQGHLSLVDVAHARADRVVVSIYVNPTQFGPNEDLASYPCDPERDHALCRDRGVDVLFMPDDEVLYRGDHTTWVTEESLSLPLCGRSRPAHFRGVTTIVAKLFHIVEPDVAVFGRKDAQQALVIQRMVRDLNFGLDVVVAPIVREADGLAMSSRNRYLTPDQRRRATAINAGLNRAQQLYAGGETRAVMLAAAVRESIVQAGGEVDYVEVVARRDLREVVEVSAPALIAVAAFFGTTRLIDNAFLG